MAPFTVCLTQKKGQMRFYNTSHQYYCGIDLHTKMTYVCILNDLGEICLHKNIPTQPRWFLRLIEPYQENLVVGNSTDRFIVE